MGEILVPEEVSAVDCNLCEANPPAAPLWGDGRTPFHIHAYFSGITICNPGDPIAPGRVIMHQTALNSCKWSGTRSDGWKADLNMGGAGATSISLTKGIQQAFVGSVLFDCAIEFTNLLICIFPADIGFGGTCRLTWFTDPIPEFIANDMGFMPVVDSLYDPINEAADKRTYRMTNPIGQTNIQIKVDTDDIPP